MRYRFLKWIDKLLHREVERCVDCGKELDVLEVYYFDCRCRKCDTRHNEDLLVK